MKIEVTAAPFAPCDALEVWAEGKRISQPTAGIYSHQWDESDLAKLLTEKQLQQLEKGECVFNVPTWKIRILTGKQVPKNREQLLFSSQW